MYLCISISIYLYPYTRIVVVLQSLHRSTGNLDKDSEKTKLDIFFARAQERTFLVLLFSVLSLGVYVVGRQGAEVWGGLSSGKEQAMRGLGFRV